MNSFVFVYGAKSNKGVKKKKYYCVSLEKYNCVSRKVQRISATGYSNISRLCNPTSENKEVAQLSAKIAKFSAAFQNEVSKEQPNNNTVMSPFSVEVLLALLTLGAESHTHEELMNALQLPSDNFTRSAFKILSEQLKDVKGVTLDMANKIFVKEGKELNPDFKRDSVEVFNSDIEAIDFNDKENAANVINTWVESKTNNRIKELLKPEAFDSQTRVVLINAIYFKGSWKTKFNKDLTERISFQSSTGAFAMVPTMMIHTDFPYIHDYKLNAKFLQLPYEGEKMSMVFALPDEGGSLPDLQAKLATEYNIRDIVADMRLRDVDVTIPKFKIETTLDLIESLPKLGINSIFDKWNSQLTKITSKRLYVTKAVQKAFIEVNEEGAEAAAATAFVVSLPDSVGVSQVYEEFYADRPFAFYLLHGDNILFTGSVNVLK